MIRRALLIGGLIAVLLPATAGGSAPNKFPETTVNSGPPKVTTSGSATFTFTSSDPQAKFACAIDQSAFSRCTSPLTYDGLPDGRHTFWVISFGEEGSDPTPASWGWTIDRVPPSDVASPRAHVSYGHLDLTWRLSATSDAARVLVMRSTNAKAAATRKVYDGSGESYSEARFANGAYHKYKIQTIDLAGNVSPGIEVVVKPSALLLAPADGATLGSVSGFRWRAVPHATFYNAQLFLGTHKVLSAWPLTPKLKLARHWSYGGRKHTLKPGLYTWYVWPGFGPRAKANYGAVIGQSSFRIR